MKQIYFFLIILFTLNSYSQIGAEITSVTTGTLSGVPFTISYTNNSTDTAVLNLSGGGFSGAPLSSSQPVFVVGADTNWSVTFDSPISNLRLYCVYWRTTTFEFDQAFTIVSGTTNFLNSTGNELSTVEFSDGIIEFTNPVTTLNSTVISGDASQIVFTFGLPEVLSTEENEIIANKLTVYPNPSSDFIKINGLTEIENYGIYNVLGAQMLKGSVSNNQEINIQDLTNGLYFLKFENRNTIKFVKE